MFFSLSRRPDHLCNAPSFLFYAGTGGSLAGGGIGELATRLHLVPRLRIQELSVLLYSRAVKLALK